MRNETRSATTSARRKNASRRMMRRSTGGVASLERTRRGRTLSGRTTAPPGTGLGAWAFVSESAIRPRRKPREPKAAADDLRVPGEIVEGELAGPTARRAERPARLRRTETRVGVAWPPETREGTLPSAPVLPQAAKEGVDSAS